MFLKLISIQIVTWLFLFVPWVHIFEVLRGQGVISPNTEIWAILIWVLSPICFTLIALIGHTIFEKEG